LNARYLLDTNVLSEPMKAAPHPGLMRRLRDHQDEVATAAPVWHELIFGMCRLRPSKRRAALEDYLLGALSALLVFPYDTAAAARHGEERARLALDGKMPPFVDGQIAAIAQVNNLVLVTRNAADFKDFANLEVEDWAR
jgi:tRNA(fMet)-specific endonuclease VapC